MSCTIWHDLEPKISYCEYTFSTIIVNIPYYISYIIYHMASRTEGSGLVTPHKSDLPGPPLAASLGNRAEPPPSLQKS